MIAGDAGAAANGTCEACRPGMAKGAPPTTAGPCAKCSSVCWKWTARAGAGQGGVWEQAFIGVNVPRKCGEMLGSLTPGRWAPTTLFTDRQ